MDANFFSLMFFFAKLAPSFDTLTFFFKVSAKGANFDPFTLFLYFFHLGTNFEKTKVGAQAPTLGFQKTFIFCSDRAQGLKKMVEQAKKKWATYSPKSYGPTTQLRKIPLEKLHTPSPTGWKPWYH